MASWWISLSSEKYCIPGKYWIIGSRKRTHGFSFIWYVFEVLNPLCSHSSGLSLAPHHLHTELWLAPITGVSIWYLGYLSTAKHPALLDFVLLYLCSQSCDDQTSQRPPTAQGHIDSPVCCQSLSAQLSGQTRLGEWGGEEKTSTGGHRCADKLRWDGLRSLMEKLQEPGSSVCLLQTLNRGVESLHTAKHGVN